MASNINIWTYIPLGILLFLSLVLSMTFSFSITATTSTRTRQHLIAFYAFAQEGIQLTLLAFGLYHTCAIAASSECLRTHLYPLPESITLAACLPAYVAAILTVDIVESLVILQTIRHPVQAQTLVLTRKMLWPAMLRWWKRMGCKISGITMPKRGGLVVVAKGGLGLRNMQRIVLVRRMSTGWTSSTAHHTTSTVQNSKTSKTWRRRHSFPDEQLNTWMAVNNERSTSEKKETDDRTPSKQSRGRGIATSAKVSFNGRDSSDSRVRTILSKLEGDTRRSRKVSDGRVDSFNGSPISTSTGSPTSKASRSCERAAKIQVAPIWRPAGGKLG